MCVIFFSFDSFVWSKLRSGGNLIITFIAIFATGCAGERIFKVGQYLDEDINNSSLAHFFVVTRGVYIIYCCIFYMHRVFG